MNSLIVIITLIFLVGRHRLRHRRRHDRSSDRRRSTRSIKTIAGLCRADLPAADHQPVHRLLQLHATWRRSPPSSWPTSLQSANLGALVAAHRLHRRRRSCSTCIITGAIPKWAIFAPIFVPLLHAARRRPRDGARGLPRRRFADQRDHAAECRTSPLIVTFAQRYEKDAGVGTVVALMLPYTVILLVVWMLLLRRLVPARDPARPG